MTVKAFVNVTVLPRTQKKAFANRIKALSGVERVLTISKDIEQYVNQGIAQERIPPLDPVDFIIYITADSCADVMKTVMNIRQASNRVESTLTSFAFLDETPDSEKQQDRKSARRQK